VTAQPTESATEVFEGRATIAVNPRVVGNGIDRVHGWFNSPSLIYDSLKEAGYTELDLNSLQMGKVGVTRKISLVDDAKKDEALYIINRRFVQGQNLDGAAIANIVYRGTLNGNYTVDIVFRYNDGTLAQVGPFLTSLYEKMEIAASEYYKQYAQDILTQGDMEGFLDNRTVYDYSKYEWAKDILAGQDTVFKLLYPPVASVLKTYSGSSNSVMQGGRSPVVMSAVIVFASIVFAVFLAFCLNALKTIRRDDKTMAKIHGALGKGSEDKS
jgi:hypothetical protein